MLLNWIETFLVIIWISPIATMSISRYIIYTYRRNKFKNIFFFISLFVTCNATQFVILRVKKRNHLHKNSKRIIYLINKQKKKRPTLVHLHNQLQFFLLMRKIGRYKNIKVIKIKMNYYSIWNVLKKKTQNLVL